MVDGNPSPARFADTLGPMLERTAEGGREVCVYGEMVALLWEDGEVDAAVGLEDLWNDLAASHRFSLLCAYPVAAFAGAAHTAPFRRMCQQHTGVTPTESYARLTEPEDQLYALAILQQEAAAGAAEIATLRAQHAHLVDASRQEVVAREQALGVTRDVADEIGTPIDAVVGLAGRLLDTPLSDDQRSLAEGLRTAAQALQGSAHDLVDFSALEAGGLRPDVGELDVAEVLHEVGELMAPAARARGRELVVECDPALPLARRGDARRLRRVLANLVRKAVELDEEGVIVLRAGPAAGGQVRLEVADAGRGVLPEDRQRLFDGFLQADPPTTRPHGGGELALSVSRRLVQAMGGRTGVDAAAGHGSTVWFTVPLPVDWFGVPLPAAPEGAGDSLGPASC
jgi:signal transduction histidine kinase